MHGYLFVDNICFENWTVFRQLSVVKKTFFALNVDFSMFFRHHFIVVFMFYNSKTVLSFEIMYLMFENWGISLEKYLTIVARKRAWYCLILADEAERRVG